MGPKTTYPPMFMSHGFVLIAMFPRIRLYQVVGFGGDVVFDMEIDVNYRSSWVNTRITAITTTFWL